MSDQLAFEKLKDFFENRAVCRRAVAGLASSAEMSLVVSERTYCTFFKRDGNPVFELREAQNPDIIFFVSPDAVEALVSSESEDIGELGILIAKQYLAGSVKIKIPGSVLGLFSRGYLSVLRAGGSSFMGFIASHGLTGLGRIKSFIQDLKSKR